jgi:hypothetical protein
VVWLVLEVLLLSDMLTGEVVIDVMVVANVLVLVFVTSEVVGFPCAFIPVDDETEVPVPVLIMTRVVVMIVEDACSDEVLELELELPVLEVSLVSVILLVSGEDTLVIVLVCA